MIRFLTLLIVLILSACGFEHSNHNEHESKEHHQEINKKTANTEKQNERLSIVTTFSPLYSFVSNIVGDKADVINLVPVGVSIHHFEPRPSDVKALQNADILVENGLHLEEFLHDIVEAASNNHLLVLDTSTGVETKKFAEALEVHEEDNHEEEAHDEEEENHHHEGDNPHIWLSLDKAKIQSKNILESVTRKDPENTEYYEENYNVFIEKIDATKVDLQIQFANTEKKNFIVFHNAYQYFLKEFGLLSYQAGVLEEFPGKEPSFEYIKEVSKLLKSKEVDIIFTEPQFSPKLVQTLASDYNTKVFEIDPIGLELSKDAYLNNIHDIGNSFINAFQK
jgi:zinc transport system substrate-binding protein